MVAVQLAIIKLSNGSLPMLRELVQKARRDFRDVLYPAQAPEQFKGLRDDPPPLWGEIPNARPLKPGEERAMQERDQRQWIDWLSS